MYIKRDSKFSTTLFLLDELSLCVSFIISAFAWLNGFNSIDRNYGFLLTISVLAAFCANSYVKSFKHFFQRGKLAELIKTLKQVVLTFFIVLCCLFFLKNSDVYSRGFLIIFGCTDLVITYALRLIVKYFIKESHIKSGDSSVVMVVTTANRIEEIVSHAQEEKSWDYRYKYIAVIDEDMVGKSFGEWTVNCSRENMMDIARSEVIDEVIIHVGYHNPELEKIVKDFQSMGITVHIVLNNLSFPMPNVRMEKFSGFNVVTTSNNMITHRQVAAKRLLDIIGSVVGLILTGIISIFVVPAIKIESKGPAIYSQIRVGRNGRKFRIYKFRSMYQDADERKAALMKDNKMDGFMFKVDDDPRITKVGKFIRKTSIDELPQFWNVLKGEMSLVGTRPPTLDEFEKYENHHKNRLSFKPGITGMWQATGRSDITDFEEVVKLDSEYIENWSIKLDIKLLVLTVLNVIRKKGAE